MKVNKTTRNIIKIEIRKLKNKSNIDKLFIGYK